MIERSGLPSAGDAPNMEKKITRTGTACAEASEPGSVSSDIGCQRLPSTPPEARGEEEEADAGSRPLACVHLLRRDTTLGKGKG